MLIQSSIEDADYFDLNPEWVDEFDYQRTMYAIPDVDPGYLYTDLDNLVATIYWSGDTVLTIIPVIPEVITTIAPVSQ